MYKKHNIKLALPILLGILVACSGGTNTKQLSENPYPGAQGIPSPQIITLQALSTSMDAPQPALGKASISGALYSYTILRGLAGTIFYLTPAKGNDNRTMPDFLIGPEDSQGDVRGISDSNARFVVNNIPPGNYFLIVWAPLNWIPAEISDSNTSPRLIELGANQKNQLGIVYVPWP